MTAQNENHARVLGQQFPTFPVTDLTFEMTKK